MRERGGDRAEHEQERPREKAAEPAGLDERRREEDGERLGEHVEAADVRELVRDHRLELLAADDPQEAGRHGERRAAGPASDDEGPREAVVDQAELRRSDVQLGGDAIGRRAQERVLGERERPRVEHAEQRPVAEPVDGDRGAEGAEREQRRAPFAADQPADAGRERREEPDQDEGLEEVRRDPAAHYPSSSRSSPSLSSPRGGQSGSGASQRLEQCSDATFWSGTRM